MKERGRKKIAPKKVRKKEGITLNARNFLLAAIGVIIIIIGYIFLAQPPVNSFWSLTLAPILLVIGYCVIIPIAILYVGKIRGG